jgi:hypothetical protein
VSDVGHGCRRWSIGRVLGFVAVIAVLVIVLHPLALAVIPPLVVAGLLVVLGRVVFRR